MPKDGPEAVKYLKLAADQGVVDACATLGANTLTLILYTLCGKYAFLTPSTGGIFRVGDVVPQDHKEALKYYTLSAEAGHAVSQNNLGPMLYLPYIQKKLPSNWVIASLHAPQRSWHREGP